MNDTLQLTPSNGYDAKSRMIFSAPINGSIPDSKPKIEFSRINIETTYPDGTKGPLIIPTSSRLFSFGVSENINPDNGKVSGWVMAICLHNRDGATEEEKAWVETFNKIVEVCIDHVIENREELNQFELQRTDLRKFNPLYYRKEKVTDPKTGKTSLKVVDGAGPTLYAKLIYSKKTEKFVSQFFDTKDQPLNPLDLIGTYCYVQAAIKIESIFIGSKISLQVKLYECDVDPANTGIKRLLARPKANTTVLSSFNSSCSVSSAPIGEGDDDETGSLLEEDKEEKQEPKKLTVKRVVKKVVPKS